MAAAWAWLIGLASGVALFLLAPFVRDRLVPRGLAGVGTVSYSIFLLHLGVLWMLLPWLKVGEATWWGQLLALAGLLAVLLPCCYLTYRLVERPGQRLGQALLRRPGPPPSARPPESPAAVRTATRPSRSSSRATTSPKRSPPALLPFTRRPPGG